MTVVYLVRHGVTDWNIAHRTQGHSDIDLNEEGREQARSVAAELAPIPLHAVYSSDLSRAVNTAITISQGREMEVVVDRRLREIDEGEWEGLTEDEIVKRWPDVWESRHWAQRPGGESPGEVRSRSLLAVRDMVSAHPDASVAAVASQGNIRLIVAEALDYTNVKASALRGLRGGEGVRIDAHLRDEQLVLGQVTMLDGSPANLRNLAPGPQ